MDSMWEEGFKHMEEFVRANGNAMVPAVHECADGFDLGRWAERQRTFRNSLDADRKARLEALKGWIWDIRDHLAWEEGFEHLEEFVAAESDASVPYKHITPDGFDLWRWVERQRIARNTMDPVRKIRLEAVQGWTWQVKR